MIWIPFAGAVAEGAGTILEKRILKRKEIGYKDYTVWGFLAIALVAIPLLFFFWQVDAQAFELKNILIFAFVIVMSIAANLCVLYAIKWEKVTELEPIRLFQPLFIILLALIFYAEERQRAISVVAPALIASFALVFSHIKRHHFQFNKHLIAAFLGSLFFALELVTSKAILPYYSGITFYFIRCFSIFIITFAIFRPKLSKINNKFKGIILIVGAIWVFYRVVLYFGYLKMSIVFTTLLFLLAPIFIYLFARIFLKEKLTRRNIIATIVILACIAYAILVNWQFLRDII